MKSSVLNLKKKKVFEKLVISGKPSSGPVVTGGRLPLKLGHSLPTALGIWWWNSGRTAGSTCCVSNAESPMLSVTAGSARPLLWGRLPCVPVTSFARIRAPETLRQNAHGSGSWHRNAPGRGMLFPVRYCRDTSAR